MTRQTELPIHYRNATQDDRPRTACCAKNCSRFAKWMLVWSPPITNTPGCRPRQFTLCTAHLRHFLGSGLTIEPYSQRDNK